MEDYLETLWLNEKSSWHGRNNQELIDLMHALESLPDYISKAEYLAAYKKIWPCKVKRELKNFLQRTPPYEMMWMGWCN